MSIRQLKIRLMTQQHGGSTFFGLLRLGSSEPELGLDTEERRLTVEHMPDLVCLRRTHLPVEDEPRTASRTTIQLSTGTEVSRLQRVIHVQCLVWPRPRRNGRPSAFMRPAMLRSPTPEAYLVMAPSPHAHSQISPSNFSFSMSASVAQSGVRKKSGLSKIGHAFGGWLEAAIGVVGTIHSLLM